MKKRNTHFEKKYQKAQKINDFFVYTFLAETKSNLDLALSRDLNKIHIKRLCIPSSFRLEKNHNTQGPLISMIYGSNLNFAKLSYLEKHQVLGIKRDNLIYSHQTLKDVVTYRSPVNLCYSAYTVLKNKLVDFLLLAHIMQRAPININ